MGICGVGEFWLRTAGRIIIFQLLTSNRQTVILFTF
jgi:hypothetical protein